jgi:FAD/FMN-containing dehydrogenase
MLCAGGAQTSAVQELPALDGQLHDDLSTRQAAATDWGGHVHRAPVAVLTPASVADVVRIVKYANQRRLKIAMRGQGHSVYGQAQVDGGIVIDSRTLNAIKWYGAHRLDVQPGALWSSVATEALKRTYIPPVLPDALMLSVGGTISAGGIGDTSCVYGAQVDHVVGLDVVTGRGDLVTCSDSHNNELFYMVLAGLGQCGIIVRARLRLEHAPKYVVVRSQQYRDSSALVQELARLARSATLPPILGAEVTKEADGRWRFALITGTSADEPTDKTTPYWDHLDRRTASIAATKSKGTPNPSLALVLPERPVRSFLASLLSDAKAASGIWRVEMVPMITARFKRPLHMLPEGELAFTLRLQRRASADNAPDHETMLGQNDLLVRRCLTLGGKIYPPFAPVLSREDWQRHYGPQLWERFAAAKRHLDPNGVLTPGAGVFG